MFLLPVNLHNSRHTVWELLYFDFQSQTDISYNYNNNAKCKNVDKAVDSPFIINLYNGLNFLDISGQLKQWTKTESQKQSTKYCTEARQFIISFWFDACEAIGTFRESLMSCRNTERFCVNLQKQTTITISNLSDSITKKAISMYKGNCRQKHYLNTVKSPIYSMHYLQCKYSQSSNIFNRFLK